MAEPILDQSEVLALVGERVPARVTQHVRVDVTEAGAPAGRGDHVADRSAHHLAAALRHEQPGQRVLTGREVALQSSSSSPASGCSVSSEPFTRLTQMREPPSD